MKLFDYNNVVGLGRQGRHSGRDMEWETKGDNKICHFHNKLIKTGTIIQTATCYC